MQRQQWSQRLALTLFVILANPAAYAGENPILVSMKGDSACAREFEARLSRDPGLRSAVGRQGKDKIFTTWMRRHHPHVFATECMKHADVVVRHFKHTYHMAEFDKLLSRRRNLRARVARMGYNDAFAEWILPQYPNIFRAHFNQKEAH